MTADTALDAVMRVTMKFDDPAKIDNTFLFKANPTTVYGADTQSSVDATGETTLLRFDLAAVPPSATVVSAALTVKTNDSAVSDAKEMALHVMRQSWSEAEATHLVREAGNSWAADGAMPPSRDATAFATFLPDKVETEYTIEIPPIVIDDWLTVENFGLAIGPGASTSHLHLHTDDSLFVPRLVLELDVPVP